MVESHPAPVDEESAGLRAETYALLARLFWSAPDEGLLHVLAPMAETVAAGPVGEAWSGLGAAARATDPADADREFHTLFIGLGRGEVVPYASWYLTGFLMGRPLVALRTRLSGLGFERRTGVTEPEDHVAALFDVMGGLAHPEQGDSLETQRAFFGEFVAPWTERFMADVQQSGNARLYAAVARLGERFIVLEKQYLGLAEGTATVSSPGAESGVS